MRTLILLLMIAAGTGVLLYCRVDLGMSWDDISASLSGLVPRILAIAVVLAGLAATITYMARAGRDE